MNTVLDTGIYNGLDLLKVDESSKLPKYLQIVEIILSDIRNGIFSIGDRIPSINETSVEFYLSRDTVEKAYRVLKSKGVIKPLRGKGYYVASSGKLCAKRVLMFLNNYNEERLEFYKSFIASMPDNSEVDVLLYNGDPDQLERNINANIGAYDAYIMLPFLNNIHDNLRNAIASIPKNKLIFIHREFLECGDCSAVIDYDKTEWYDILNDLHNDYGQYAHYRLIIPEEAFYKDIWEGFTDFCLDKGLEFDAQCETGDLKIKKGQLYILKEDDHLVEILKQAQCQNLKPGRDFGVICLHDSALKEILEGGISVLALDYKKMGKEVADIVISESINRVKNAYKLIDRGSL